GMELADAMLESFVGEIGNMVAGNMSTRLAENGIHVEISPPTVIVGPTKLTGFVTAAKVPLHLEDIGVIHVILILDESE
uniref:chemotaxis protein CheC n=1 Tax=Alicyclobacillus sendaiensis TaxID=192387 RepID=UPI000A6ED150